VVEVEKLMEAPPWKVTLCRAAPSPTTRVRVAEERDNHFNPKASYHVLVRVPLKVVVDPDFQFAATLTPIGCG